MFPVEIYYTPTPEKDYLEAAIRTTLQIHTVEAPGDILVFLTGEAEIEDACRGIRTQAEDLHRSNPNTIGPCVVYPLYSSLPPKDQQKIFLPPPAAASSGGPPGRKVIVYVFMWSSLITLQIYQHCRDEFNH